MRSLRWRSLTLSMLLISGLILLSSTLYLASAASGATKGVALPGTLVELRAGPGGAHTFVRTVRRPHLTAPATATFVVKYNGFTPAAQTAFQAAVDIWASQLTSSVPIVINATFKDMPDGVLGGAGPAFYWVPKPNDPIYPIALANKLAGTDLQVGDDITAEFSSRRTDWYFGTDGNTPVNQYDFVSVALHELGHGLGFVSTARYNASNSQGSYGYNNVPALRSIYDIFMTDSTGVNVTDLSRYPNPSPALGTLYQSGALFFNGPQTRIATGGTPARLYAPNPWQEGSSISHLDEVLYPTGDPNSLMTPQLGHSEAIHDPGPITRGLFADMGWTVSGGPATATPTTTSTPTMTATSTATSTLSVSPTVTRTLNPTEIAARRWLYLPWLNRR